MAQRTWLAGLVAVALALTWAAWFWAKPQPGAPSTAATREDPALPGATTQNGARNPSVAPLAPSGTDSNAPLSHVPSVLADLDPRTLDPEDVWLILESKACRPSQRNNAANVLLNRKDARLTGRLLQMLADTQECVTWRAYCVQFLRGCQEQEPRQAVLETLFQTCAAPEPEIASAALWNLTLLSVPTVGPSVLSADERQRIVQTTLDALHKSECGEQLRAASIQSAGRLRLPEALPALRALAVQEETSAALRTRSIAALGLLKDRASEPVLRKLLESPNARIQDAARVALKELGQEKP